MKVIKCAMELLLMFTALAGFILMASEADSLKTQVEITIAGFIIMFLSGMGIWLIEQLKK